MKLSFLNTNSCKSNKYLTSSSPTFGGNLLNSLIINSVEKKKSTVKLIYQHTYTRQIYKRT